MKRTEVFLVDDHALVRAGLKAMIDQFDDFVVTGEASGVADALDGIAKRRPDVVVADLTLGAESGLDLLRTLRSGDGKTCVIILSMHADDELVSEALRLGASGYLLKEAAPSELEIALRAVVRNETYLSPAVSKRVIERYVRAAPEAKGALSMLTPRQIQILTMIANRKGTKEIAYELDLSEKTIAAHRAQIMERVGVRDLVGLVLFAVKHGLVRSAE